MFTTMIPYRTTRTMTGNRERPIADDLFRAFFGEGRMMDSFKVDVEDKGDHYLLKADLPGVAKENVHIDLQEGVLTISAETCEEKEQKETNYLFRERRTGSMSRSFNVEGIDEEAISAAYADGVLSLTLPKLAEEKPARRTIQIN